VIVLAVAVAAVAVALLLHNRGTPSGQGGSGVPPSHRVSGQATSSGLGGATTTNAPPGQESTGSTPTTTVPASGAPALTPYAGEGFALSYPAGWATDAREKSHGSYLESHWHLPGRPDVSVLIDHTPGFTDTAKAGADVVRAGTATETGYKELSYDTAALTPGPAQVWEFILSGKERVDTFYALCGTGYAVLGSAPVAEFSQYQATFAAVTASLIPGGCGAQ
jgi:hypothetical protein